MVTFKVEKEIGGRLLSIETGKVAKQAHGSAMIRYGDTVVLVAAVTDKPRPGIDFFPLTVDYREKTYAAGKIPGGFFKREGRPTNKEILTMRMIDRPVRPMFPPQYKDEVQVQCMVLSADLQNDPDIPAMVGAFAALSLSQIPFLGPLGAVRVGFVEGELVVNPTHTQLESSELDMVLTGNADAINMIEVSANQLSEQVIAEAIEKGHEEIKKVCRMIDELVENAGKQKIEVPPPADAELIEQLAAKYASELKTRKQTEGKQARKDAVKELKEQAKAELCPEDAENPQFDPALFRGAWDVVEEKVVRELLLAGTRLDGRGLEDVRPITCEIGVLPRTHGSAIFTRGETQALVVVTLGTSSDEQIVDGLTEEYSMKFMLHYNFPPFSVGECRPIRGPGRREIGHGALAQKSLERVLPDPEGFPYTIRVVSDILESNGSSSMAAVCGATLSLMDAGVAITHPVAGISIGMVSDDSRHLLLTDIVGEEDHYGDMDFKVAGTQHGITGIQMDLKCGGLTHDLVRETLDRAKTARMKILKEMLLTISEPRPNISDLAPRCITLKINPEKIGKVIGPGGKMIKSIQADTGAKIEIEDDGTVSIYCMSKDGADRACAAVEQLTEEVKVGTIYEGRVNSIKDFGAFIEILPGQDGLCHISELSNDYVSSVGDVVKLGDQVRVKVIAVDDLGRVKLSRKAVLHDEAAGK